MSMLALVEATRAIATRATADPLRWIRWTPPQDEWLRIRGARKLFRAGNQLGKSLVGLAEVIYRCTGHHSHYPVRRPPVEAWIVCTTWSQSVAIMRKFHELCPDEVIDVRRSSVFSARRGYGKDNPAVVFRSGSLVRFKTTGQGAEALASATVDVVLIDEPTTEDIYRELDRRVMRRAGVLLLTLTPINQDCVWLHALVETGAIAEVHARLTVANLTPLGSREPLRLLDGTSMDQPWIDAQWKSVPASYAPVILDGEWEVRPEGVVFDCFDPRRHVQAGAGHDPQQGAIRHCLGIDYAAIDREFGQVATLWAVQQTKDERGRTRDSLVALDHVVLTGISTNAQFAVEILAMLARRGMKWRDMDDVYGDNPVRVGMAIKRSNIQTAEALARELRIPATALTPSIRSAKDGPASSGAVDTGVRYLYERIASGALVVHPACERLIWALQTWDGTRTHPAKDVLDAARYALKNYIFPRPRIAHRAIRFG